MWYMAIPVHAPCAVTGAMPVSIATSRHTIDLNSMARGLQKMARLLAEYCVVIQLATRPRSVNTGTVSHRRAQSNPDLVLRSGTESCVEYYGFPETSETIGHSDVVQTRERDLVMGIAIGVSAVAGAGRHHYSRRRRAQSGAPRFRKHRFPTTTDPLLTMAVADVCLRHRGEPITIHPLTLCGVYRG